MAFKCAWCRSVNTVAGFILHQCLDCGKHTHADGTKDSPQRELDASDPRGWAPYEEYPEPDTQHPDRRRRPGDILTDEYIPVETVQGPFNPEPEAVAPVEPTPAPIVEPAPAPEPTPEVLA